MSHFLRASGGGKKKIDEREKSPRKDSIAYRREKQRGNGIGKVSTHGGKELPRKWKSLSAGVGFAEQVKKKKNRAGGKREGSLALRGEGEVHSCPEGGKKGG